MRRGRAWTQEERRPAGCSTTGAWCHAERWLRGRIPHPVPPHSGTSGWRCVLYCLLDRPRCISCLESQLRHRQRVQHAARFRAGPPRTYPSWLLSLIQQASACRLWGFCCWVFSPSPPWIWARDGKRKTMSEPHCSSLSPLWWRTQFVKLHLAGTLTKWPSRYGTCYDMAISLMPWSWPFWSCPVWLYASLSRGRGPLLWCSIYI